MTKQAVSAAERQRKYRESRVTLKVESAGIAFLMAEALHRESRETWKLCEIAKAAGEDYSHALKSMEALKGAADELAAHARKLMELEQERQEAELARVSAGFAGCCEADSGMGKD